MKITLALYFSLALWFGVYAQTKVVVSNIKPRLDTDGNIIDAHDGRIVKYGDKFYWYGTSYGDTNGFLKSNYFRCYSSPDLMTWKDEGCILENRPHGIYYRPHVIYNEKIRKYILWYNWYEEFWEGKFGVAVSDYPQGPFNIVNDDVKVLSSKLGVGDFSLFVDGDKQAYLTYNTIEGHNLSIEKLNEDYLSSTFENGGIITSGCEAGALFNRNGIYYLLTDYTCCFCTQGTGVRVYTSNAPLGKWELQKNINRFPGAFSPALVDKEISPNLYQPIYKRDSVYNPIQVNFSKVSEINRVRIYQFSGNRKVIDCGDTIPEKTHEVSAVANFDLSVKLNEEWHRVSSRVSIRKTSVYQIIDMYFPPVETESIRLNPSDDYVYNYLYLNEIEIFIGTQKLNESGIKLMAFLNDPNQVWETPIIPAQQTFVMPLETTNGIQYIWMGDLWGSASDNIKGHDYQYWSPPLVFDEQGGIQTMEWVDEWQVELKKNH